MDQEMILDSQWMVFACLCKIADDTKDSETALNAQIEDENAQIDI